MNTKNCTNCGRQIYPSDRFCAHCGAQQEPGIPAAELERAGSLWDPVLQKLRAATAGKYEIGRVLGTGGMAAVYLGREIKLDRAVAIKVMSPGLMLQHGMIERFHQEAVTVAALNHPNIVTIYTVEETNDLYFFVMKHIAGPSLETVIRRDGPLPKSVVIAWLTQVASALSYAHKRGVIHRDIKPANILLDDEGSAIVTDFGIAKVPRQSNLTQTGTTLGTPAYMSPEQCTSKEVTVASDQYSLGIVTYEMLAGEPPFIGPSLEVMKAHVEQRPRPITAFRPHAPPELAAAVERMLQKDPQERWLSLEEMIGSVGGRPIAHHDPLRAQLTALATPGGLRSAVGKRTAPAPPPLQEPTVTPPEELLATPPGKRLMTPPEPRAAKPAAEIPEYLEPRAPLPVASLVLSPVPPSIWEGHTLQLEATPLDAVGQPLEGREVTWESSDPEVATVARSGLLDARKPGRVVITATCEALVEQTAIDVAPVRVEELKIRPARRVVAVGHSLQMRVIVRGSDDSRLYDRPVTWSSDNPEILQVSPEGLMTAVAEGSVRVTARCEEQSGAAAVRVTAPGAPYLIGRFWWAAPVATLALMVLWLAIRPSEPRSGAENDQAAAAQSETVQNGAPAGVSQLDSAGDTGDRVLAEAALRRAAAAGDAALAAGAREADPTGFENLNGQLEQAEAELAAGNLVRALNLLDPLPQAFSDLAQLATTDREYQRLAATEARNSAQRQQNAASSAGAQQLRPTELARLNRLMRRAESALSAEDYQDARRRFLDVASAYQLLAQTVTRLARGEADDARQRALQQRQSAMEVGAAERTPDQLAAIDADRDRAQSLLGNGSYMDAWSRYERVESEYRQLAANVTAAVAREAAEAEEALDPRPPEEVLAGMIERFRQLFEQADLSGMGEELYRGRVPSDDERLLQTFFGRAEEMQAELEQPAIRIVGSSATADVKVRLDFRNRRTGERFTGVPYEFQLTFALDSSSWFLERVESR